MLASGGRVSIFQYYCLHLRSDQKLISIENGTDNISSSLSNIAGLYLTSGQADVARKYIDEALKIERSLQRDAPLANRLGMASEIYLKLSLAEESLAIAYAQLGEIFLLSDFLGILVFY